jgi:Uma2 family endonuclease
VTVLTAFNWPPIEDLDVEDLLTLPEGYRYELREGNLVIMTSSTFWHKAMAGRLYLLLHGAGLNVFQDPGVLGDRPRDNRLPDLGVVDVVPPGMATYSNLPGSAYDLVVEIVSENSLNGEYTDKMDWYARRGIPEYWIVDQTPDRADSDALVRIHRLKQAERRYQYVCERTLRLSNLEEEYRAQGV